MGRNDSKVVDEERILYAQGLEPQLEVASDNLFGIRLNLANIASAHRTPDEYRLEKKNLEDQVRQINCQLTQLPITLQNEIEKLGKKICSTDQSASAESDLIEGGRRTDTCKTTESAKPPT